MFDLTATAGIWLCQLMLQVLPDSPIADLVTDQMQQMQALHAALQCLNWVVDFSGMWNTLVVWLACVIPFYAGFWAIKGASKMSGWLADIAGMIGEIVGV